MFLRNRHALIRLGRFELYARGRQAGEPLCATLRHNTPEVASGFSLWVPGLHLSVDALHQHQGHGMSALAKAAVAALLATAGYSVLPE